MNILNAVIQVLKEHQRPAHYRQIAKEIAEHNLIEENNAGQTVETLVNAKVGIDIKALESAGKPPRFQKLPNGFIALTENAYDMEEEDEYYPDEMDEMDDDINGNEREINGNEREIDGNEENKDEIINKKLEHHDILGIIDDYKYSMSRDFSRHLNTMDFPSFEKLFNSLIRSFPIKRSTIVNRRKDGGMDYAINLGFFKNNMNLLVAVRRWGVRKNVTMDDVEDILERMKTHGFNGLIFVTSGDFDDDVYDFAEEFKEVPFFIINGEKLAWFMMERGIGSYSSKINLFKFNPKYHKFHSPKKNID